MKSTRGRIASAAVVLLGFELLGGVTGFAKQVVIAAKFGTSSAMDAFLVGVTVLGMVRVLVSLPIGQTLIPMFRHSLARDGEEAAWGIASVLLNNLTLLLTGVSVVMFMAAPYAVRVIAPGFGPETSAMATHIARIAIWSAIPLGIVMVLNQVLLSYERFAVAGSRATVQNCVVLVGMLTLADQFGIYALAAAVLAAAVVEVGLPVPALWAKLRRFYSSRVDWRHAGMLEMGALTLPLFVSAGGAELERVADRMFASLLVAGSLAALAFAHRIITVVGDVLVNPLQQATVPHFARLCAERDYSALSRHLSRYLQVVLFVVCPIAAGLALTAREIVSVTYARGAFGEESVRLTSAALALYALGFPAASVARILNRTFFALKDTRTPTKLALARIGGKVVLAALLIRPFAVGGIALAESLSQIARVVWLFLALPPEVRAGETLAMARGATRVVTLCGVMAVAVYGAAALVGDGFDAVRRLILAALVGCGVYVGAAWVLGAGGEVRYVVGTVMTLLKGRAGKAAR